MENEIINKLAQLEHIVKASNLCQKEVLTFSEFCKYCGISESHGYKLTSQNRVPHYKPSGKMVYFKRSEIDDWLLKNPVKTIDQIELEADDYVTFHKRKI
ncbi:MAG: helix-turn-helix domain-containing protein [Cytophagales bacterium]|nr:helix-turn-helix domain-containing protein [Cytophagales bacterium]